MAKVDVILTQNVVGLGAESDQVKVAAGYARNFLFPQRMAISVTAANKRRLDVLRQRRAEREAHELNTMSELAKTLSKLVLKIIVKSGEADKIYGSVTAGTIADELKHQFDVSLDKRKIYIEKPLRNLGEHEVQLKLHADVTATLKVHIESSTPVEKPEETAAAQAQASKTEGKKGEPRRSDARRTERKSAKADKTEKAE
jgi:large subunit ribosomal protein L9